MSVPLHYSHNLKYGSPSKGNNLSPRFHGQTFDNCLIHRKSQCIFFCIEKGCKYEDRVICAECLVIEGNHYRHKHIKLDSARQTFSSILSTYQDYNTFNREIDYLIQQVKNEYRELMQQFLKFITTQSEVIMRYLQQQKKDTMPIDALQLLHDLSEKQRFHSQDQYTNELVAQVLQGIYIEPEDLTLQRVTFLRCMEKNLKIDLFPTLHIKQKGFLKTLKEYSAEVISTQNSDNYMSASKVINYDFDQAGMIPHSQIPQWDQIIFENAEKVKTLRVFPKPFSDTLCVYQILNIDDDQLAVVTNPENAVYIINYRTFEITNILTLGKYELAFDILTCIQKYLLAVGCSDNKIRIFNILKKQSIPQYVISTIYGTSSLLYFRQRLIACQQKSFKIYLYRRNTFNEFNQQCVLGNHINEIRSLAILDKECFASGSHDKYIFIWSSYLWKQKFSLPEDSRVNKIEKLDDNRLITGLDADFMNIWNWKDQTKLQRIYNRGNALINSICAISPNYVITTHGFNSKISPPIIWDTHSFAHQYFSDLHLPIETISLIALSSEKRFAALTQTGLVILEVPGFQFTHLQSM